MLTIDELATYLKLKPQTIYKWAQTGKVPGAKFGKEWRFRLSTIERWIDSQIPAFPANNDKPADDDKPEKPSTRKPAKTTKSDKGADANSGGPTQN